MKVTLVTLLALAASAMATEAMPADKGKPLAPLVCPPPGAMRGS